MNIVEKLKQTEERLKEACKIIDTLRTDAAMALCGDWDKSDDGFEDQITIIDEFFHKIGYEYKEYNSISDDNNDDPVIELYEYDIDTYLENYYLDKDDI